MSQMNAYTFLQSRRRFASDPCILSTNCPNSAPLSESGNIRNGIAESTIHVPQVDTGVPCSPIRQDRGPSRRIQATTPQVDPGTHAQNA